MKYKREANELAATKKWRDIHKIWAEYKGKPRKEAVATFRLKTGHDCLAANVRKTGIYAIKVPHKKKTSCKYHVNIV
jgi:hypothetical protein